MRDTIRQYLVAHRATGEGNGFADDQSLLESGIIDSMMMIDLIAFLEKTFGITIDEDDMIPENFDSLCAIVAYVESKQA